MSDQTLGSIDALYRYPVKSMAGESLREVYVSYTGLVGDRVFACIDAEKYSKGSDFPWFTIREHPEMLLYRPRFSQPPALDDFYPESDRFQVIVKTPEGVEGSLADAAFVEHLREKFGHDFLLRFSEKGMQDARPVSLFSANTLAQLGEETGLDLDRRRFRANIYANWSHEEGFFEDDLVGQRLKVGERCELLVQKKDPRCKIIAVDPDEASLQPEVLRNVGKKHGGCAGVYCVVVREGFVRQGDAIIRIG